MHEFAPLSADRHTALRMVPAYRQERISRYAAPVRGELPGPMKRTAPFGTVLLAAILSLLGPTPARAQTIFADIAGDYATTGTLIDTSGTGTWTYYASTTATAGTLTALTYRSIGNAGNSGYGLASGSFSVPAVSDARLFGDGAVPSANQLAWHPGNGSPEFTVLRWTAGVGET